MTSTDPAAADEHDQGIERLLTLREVAKALGIDPTTVMRRANTGQIHCMRDGRIIRFRRRHVEAYITAHEAPVGTTPATPRPKRNPKYTQR